jgi:hypothetical protein
MRNLGLLDFRSCGPCHSAIGLCTGDLRVRPSTAPAVPFTAEHATTLSAPPNLSTSENMPTTRMHRLALADRQFPERRHKKSAVGTKMNIGRHAAPDPEPLSHQRTSNSLAMRNLDHSNVGGAMLMVSFYCKIREEYCPNSRLRWQYDG